MSENSDKMELKDPGTFDELDSNTSRRTRLSHRTNLLEMEAVRYEV